MASYDPGLSLEKIHQLLELGQAVKAALGAAPGPKIEISDYIEFWEFILDIVGYGAIYSDNPLRVQASVLNKLKRGYGEFDLRTARSIADRAITYLKSLETSASPSPPPLEPKQRTEPPTSFTFQGRTWIELRHTSEITNQIAQVSLLLDNIIQHASGTNLPPEGRLLSELERKQLIALLETALALLKTPLVEKGLLDKAGKTLKDGAAKAVEKEVQEGLGQLMGIGAKKLFELIAMLFE